MPQEDYDNDGGDALPEVPDDISTDPSSSDHPHTGMKPGQDGHGRLNKPDSSPKAASHLVATEEHHDGHRQRRCGRTTTAAPST